ncbi:MAG: GTP-binding protein [Thermoguttaceae bacterium]|jgi:G3E family GTPase|nr:GTP-binding protein [Thermoguttaceae bacterium]
MKTKLILVGGFLGSGKTTLLWESARRLTGRGRSVGLVTNDQAPDLVDTAFLSRSGAGIQEVSGSCFCCNFGGFIDAVQSLVKQKADTIIAEPVGSCTDLSATIMQPLKDKHPEIGLAPLTVLADPGRVLEVLQRSDSRMHSSALYILRLQMDEADHILLNKADTLNPDECDTTRNLLETSFPAAKIGSISAKTGDGVDAWLDAILADNAAGQRVVEVDYDRYAEGEAVLGWLNAVIHFHAPGKEPDWREVAGNLLNRMHSAFKDRRAEIGHVKLALNCDGKEGTASLTRLGGEIMFRDFDSLAGQQASLILNARVQMSPDELEAIVRKAVALAEKDGGVADIRTLRCLMPGRPNPTHRYARAV